MSLLQLSISFPFGTKHTFETSQLRLKMTEQSKTNTRKGKEGPHFPETDWEGFQESDKKTGDCEAARREVTPLAATLPASPVSTWLAAGLETSSSQSKPRGGCCDPHHWKLWESISWSSLALNSACEVAWVWVTTLFHKGKPYFLPSLSPPKHQTQTVVVETELGNSGQLLHCCYWDYRKKNLNYKQYNPWTPWHDGSSSGNRPPGLRGSCITAWFLFTHWVWLQRLRAPWGRPCEGIRGSTAWWTDALDTAHTWVSEVHWHWELTLGCECRFTLVQRGWDTEFTGQFQHILFFIDYIQRSKTTPVLGCTLDSCSTHKLLPKIPDPTYHTVLELNNKY